MNTVLVTGGAGFIGSHLAESLLEMGNVVYIIDDLSTGKMENIEHLKKNPNFKYIIDSILNRSALKKLIDKCDTIFHLAAAVGVKLITENPLKTIETNVKGTETVLELAANAKNKKKIIFTSSSEVYVHSNKIPLREDSDLITDPSYKPRWSYAHSKVIDEFLALTYWREKKLSVIIARLFNVVGPRQSAQYGMVIPRFVKCALSEKPIEIYGDGKQTRTFVWVEDVADTLIKLSQSPKAIGQIFNIGGSQEININRLAKIIKEKIKSKSPVQYIPYEKIYQKKFEDIKRRVPDISKIQKLIGFKPSKNIQEIIEGTIKYFREKNSPKLS